MDDTQPHALTRAEKRGPVVARAVAVDEEGVSRSVDVRDIGRIHPHLAPVDAFLERLILTGKDAGQRLPLHIAVAGVDLELAEDSLGRKLVVVGQHPAMLTGIDGW